MEGASLIDMKFFRDVPVPEYTDLQSCFANMFDDAVLRVIDYATEHSDIEGVNEIVSDLSNVQDQYNEEKQDMIAMMEPPLKEAYEKVKNDHSRKTMFIAIGIVGIFLQWQSNSNIVINFGLIGMNIGIIGFIYFFIRKRIDYKRYSKLEVNSKSEICQRRDYYMEYANQCYNKIDNFYLNTLDPMMREQVLLRRELKKLREEQAYQHTAHMRTQEQLIENQQAMTEEQRATRQINQQILDIEKRRTGF